MSFHYTQVTTPLLSPTRPPRGATIAGHDFPAARDQAQAIRAVEEALVNISMAIASLAQQVERLDREVTGISQQLP
jgi:hypothetical protein